LKLKSGFNYYVHFNRTCDWILHRNVWYRRRFCETGKVGSYFGSKTSMKTNSELLKAGLAIIVLLLALSVVYKELF
jgi:hypothetical protein